VLRLLDLFSGIGGFSLGLERTGGFKTVAFCEIEPYARAVLRKHWPEVPCFDDVRTLTADRLAADGIAVDAICGGFPCQDLSSAGEKAGIDGERSGLWREYARLIGELRPAVVIVENVADLLRGPEEQPGAWFGRVLADLAAIGFDAEWHCIPAASVDAPHIRDRVWLVAYPNSGRMCGVGAVAVDGRALPEEGVKRFFHRSGRGEGALANADGLSLVGTAIARQERAPWAPEPALDRVVDGVPRRVVQPQLRALGNAVVPQVPELIGRAILAARAA
jgi:DNA (cytosine-5)-methyltransferase 1